MYLTIKQQLKHLSKTEYQILRELCHIAKNLTNQAIYNVRQQYFTDKKYLSYNKNYHLLKTSENYKILNSNMAEQILKQVDEDFKSYFGLLKLAKNGQYSYKDCKIPHYLPKDGFTTLIIAEFKFNGNLLTLPYSNGYKKTHQNITITVPKIVLDKKVKEIRILPKANARFFEIQYVYKVECNQRNLNINNALALDLGVNNLMTAVSNKGDSFIIDGRKLKSINQWFNKQNARLQSIKDKQKLGYTPTKKQNIIANKRNNQVNDYISKAVKMVIKYCVTNDIGTLVVGYNTTFQKNSHLGKENNQNFVNIPFGKLRKKLKYLCELNNIVFIEQEESYTSKASFWDKDFIPVYDKNNTTQYSFSGKRVHRGLYKRSNGKILNADVNGALNIMRKCNVVDLTVLYARGDVNTPIRIRVA
ncbi:MAG: transposase [Acutalibacteraceae bacterium]|nr:transposase [Acutalibacteraceae bacterium]